MVVALVLAVPAQAADKRLRWGGLSVHGSAPSQLESAITVHLELVLRELGARPVAEPPFDLEARATCWFQSDNPSERNRARCVVETEELTTHRRGRREALIPFGDQEDLAQSVALLLASSLQRDLGYTLDWTLAESAPETTPAPALSVGAMEQTAKSSTPRVRASSDLLLDIAPVLVLGATGEPPLYGGAVRVLFAGYRSLRLGGWLSLSGSDVRPLDYHVSFLRTILGLRLGAGFRRSRVMGELMATPSLMVLHTDAHGDGASSWAAFALGAESGLSVRLSRRIGVRLGLAFLWSTREQRVVTASSPVVSIGAFSFELSMGFSFGVAR